MNPREIRGDRDFVATVELSGLTNAGAQEAPVVLQTHPATGEKICDGCDRLFAAPRARTHCQDKITQRQPGTRLQDLAIPLHVVPVLVHSSSDAISRCEYLIRAPCAVIHFLCTLELTVERHFCSIFEHEIVANRSEAGSPSQIVGIHQKAMATAIRNAASSIARSACTGRRTA